MSKPVWKKGPPPSLGWWPASYFMADGFLRWWDGELWSRAVTEYCDANEAAHEASIPTTAQKTVYWKARPKSWPARSRT